jgi:hypothetical protein
VLLETLMPVSFGIGIGKCNTTLHTCVRALVLLQASSDARECPVPKLRSCCLRITCYASQACSATLEMQESVDPCGQLLSVAADYSHSSSSCGRPEREE